MKDFLNRYFYPLAQMERYIYPIALFIGALALFNWYWTTTPSYAITSIIHSIREHDVATVEKYVDIDSLASHAFDDLIDGPARTQLLGHTDSLVGVGFVRFFKHEIVGMAHQRVLEAIGDSGMTLDSVAEGSPETLQHYRITPKIKQVLIDYGLTRYGFKGIKYLHVNGAFALLGIDFFSPKLNSTYTVEFRLEDAGGYWRITQLTNLNDLVARYLERKQPSQQHIVTD